MTTADIHEMIKTYGPWAVGVGSTLDNTGVPIFFVAGMAGAAAVGVQREWMLVAAILGSIVGDLVVYGIGRYVLTKDRITAGGIGEKLKPVIDRMEPAMKAWGFVTLTIGRFVPYVGKVTPLMAGAYAMSWFKAIASTVLGSIILMGFFYFYGQAAIDLVNHRADAIKIVSTIIGTTALALLIFANIRLKRTEKPAAAPDDTTGRKSRYRDRAPQQQDGFTPD